MLALMTALLPPITDAPPATTVEVPGSKRPFATRLVRGRADDPAWARPGLLVLLAVTACAYLWDLSASGWANSFYAAAVQAGTHSWKAAFFGSFDAANAITVDKPPAALWIMEISGRLFGFSSFSMLAPQAIEGVAAVGILYAAVRRATSAGGALLAAAAMAVTPVAALIFRFNNPDALLVLLMVAAAYATIRAIEAASTRWIALAGVCIGLGFLTKMMQVFLVVPAMAIAYLVAAPSSPARRLWHVVVFGLVTLMSAGWWVAIVELTPASMRPYVGGSQNNSELNLIFGYNGIGRLTGNETGSVGGGGVGGTSMWGSTGITRLFNAQFGGQASWLIPLALASIVLVAVLTWRRPRTDLLRASAILWGGWLVVTGLTFSFSAGIIHPYYTVALAPGIGAMVGLGGYAAWRHRSSVGVRLAVGASLAMSVAWALVLLHRTPSWAAWLSPFLILAGLVSVLGVIFWTSLAPSWRVVVSTAMIAAVFAAPLGYVISTVRSPHSGSLPTAGPSVQGAGGFGPGGAGPGGGVPRIGALGRGAITGAPQGIPGSTAGSATGAPPTAGGQPPAGFGGFGSTHSAAQGARGLGGVPTLGGSKSLRGFTAGGGGLLTASTPSKAVVATISKNADHFTWVVATTGSQQASGYQLASGDPVMSIGGFNGTDPSPTLAQFKNDVKAHRIHYYVASSVIGGGPSITRGATGVGAGVGRSATAARFRVSTGGSGDASAIERWVKASFKTVTVGGTVLYDLTAPIAGGG